MQYVRKTATGVRDVRYDAPPAAPIPAILSDGCFPGGAAEVSEFTMRRSSIKHVATKGTALCTRCGAVVPRRGGKGEALLVATPLSGIACRRCLMKCGNSCFLKA